MLWILLLLGGHHLTVVYSGKVSYRGHSLIKVWPKHESHVTELRHLQDEHKNNSNELEFWKGPGKLHHASDLRVSPEQLPHVLHRLKRSTIPFTVTSDDIQSKIDDQINSKPEGFKPENVNTSTYHTYDEIMTWLDHLGKTCGPVCSVFSIGRSFEGRDLKVIRLGIPQPEKPIVWIDAGIHAREWIAPATALYFVDQMLHHTEDDFFIRYLMNYFTWFILPLANPDGYEHTWNHDRLWRKTRSRQAGSICVGVDPNRNWDFHWGGGGASEDPCGENYHGRAPFSEPETRAMSAFLRSLRGKLKIYLTLHSYGQYWLTPWGFTYHVPPDYTTMLTLARRAADVLKARRGSQYRVGASARMLYLAAGGSDDWVKGVMKVPYAYTVELGDTGEHGFLLPSTFIPETGEEITDALRSLAMDVIKASAPSSNQKTDEE